MSFTDDVRGAARGDGQSTVARKTRVTSGTIPSPRTSTSTSLQARRADLLRGRGDLVVDPCALHEDQLAAAAHERRGDGDQLRQRGDRARRHLVEALDQRGILGAGALDA